MNTIDNLVENSKSAMIAAIEIHNKPIFPYRYEIVTVLLINAWELILKAYILTNNPDVKVIREDGTTKPFEECLKFVASELGNEFDVIKESIYRVYEYRCNIIHFYTDEIDLLIFSLLRPNVIFYSEFIENHFGIDLTEETNLVLLPIGFRRPISPIDFITNISAARESSPAVKTFIESIVNSAKFLQQAGIEESILVDYRLAVINEKRIKNADIIAGITKDSSEATIYVEAPSLDKVTISTDEDAKKIKIDEEALFEKVYTETYQMVVNYCYVTFNDFKKNKDFNAIMQTLKGIPSFHRKRYLDFVNQKGGSKDYYTKAIYIELAKHYETKV